MTTSSAPIGPPSAIPPGSTQWHLTLHHAGESFGTHSLDGDFLALLKRHFAWLRERHDDGRVLFSGPNRKTGLGIIVYVRLSTAEVEADVATEPMVAAGLRTVEIIPWDVAQVLGMGSFELHRPPG